MAFMKPGVRVVRGPDFNFGRQDGGEGHVGTVVYVPKQGSSDQKVTVIWDSGRELRYRAGENSKYDLRMLDIGTIGVIHDSITCDGCQQTPLIGIRWKCAVCHDFDLCIKCYMGNKHHLSHSFVRIVAPQTNAFTVAPRDRMKAKNVMGIFENAEVMRGPHWKWKNDDGGDVEVGYVKAVKTWGQTSYRGAVEVQWKATKKSGVYRVGGEGCVDLVYTEEAGQGQYYPEHLPLVDVVNPGDIKLKCSDRIRVNLDLQSFKALQDNDTYGGWNDGMYQCTKEVGTIVSVLFDGRTIRAQYEDGQNWIMNRNAVTRIHSFSVKEAVKILEDFNAVRDLQEGHGGWNDEMQEALGKVGRIARIDKDGDLRVKVGSRTWIFNPTCCAPVEDEALSKGVPNLSVSDLEKEEEDDAEQMARDLAHVAGAVADLFVALLRGVPGADPGEVSLVEAAAKGDLDKVKAIVRHDPSKVNMTVENKTALQLASYEGHNDIVVFLLDNKADIHIRDDEGDTALHYSAFGEESRTMRTLLDRGAKKDCQNKKGLTPLHVAVGKAEVTCAKLLVSAGASVGIKDKDGDTAMHDCIIQKQKQPNIAKAVLESKQANFQTTNSKGFNILQWATLKNHQFAADLVISRRTNMVNDQMKEGFTALHIAAANDHIEIAGKLIKQGNANKNVQDENGRTPLHIAVSQSHKRVVELLIQAECNVDMQDNDGNTAMHVAQIHRALPDQLARVLGVKHLIGDVGIEITCLLVEARANLEVKNKKGHSPLDLCTDTATKEFLKRLSKQAFSKTMQKTKRGVTLPGHWDPMEKMETLKRITLNPASGLQQKEFEGLKKKFQQTLPQARIIKIERVQNKFFWEHYFLTRMKFEHEYGPGCANELDLYHGTTPDLVDVICTQNLDPRLAGERVGSLFGKGAYFAVTAKYSDGYASVDKATRHKFMFVVKVLAGKCTLGDPEYKRPPPIDDKNPHSKLFDCCVDSTKNPRIYCIFDTNQIYPEYVIEYI